MNDLRSLSPENWDAYLQRALQTLDGTAGPHSLTHLIIEGQRLYPPQTHSLWPAWALMLQCLTTAAYAAKASRWAGDARIGLLALLDQTHAETVRAAREHVRLAVRICADLPRAGG